MSTKSRGSPPWIVFVDVGRAARGRVPVVSSELRRVDGRLGPRVAAVPYVGIGARGIATLWSQSRDDQSGSVATAAQGRGLGVERPYVTRFAADGAAVAEPKARLPHVARGLAVGCTVDAVAAPTVCTKFAVTMRAAPPRCERSIHRVAGGWDEQRRMPRSRREECSHGGQARGYGHSSHNHRAAACWARSQAA
eukprot:COSAG01_NODE_16750_length_1208_cov_1.572588_2_plen_194_part_00